MDLDHILFLTHLLRFLLPFPQVKTDLCAYGKEGKTSYSLKRKSENNIICILSYFRDLLILFIILLFEFITLNA